MQSFHACLGQIHKFPFRFLKTMVLMLDSFILKWQAVADINQRYTSSNSTFSCNIMTFFLLLGALLASLWHCTWIPCVIQGLWYCSKHDENSARTVGDQFLLINHLLERGTAHWETISITWRFQWILTTLDLTTLAAGAGYGVL